MTLRSFLYAFARLIGNASAVCSRGDLVVYGEKREAWDYEARFPTRRRPDFQQRGAGEEDKEAVNRSRNADCGTASKSEIRNRKSEIEEAVIWNEAVRATGLQPNPSHLSVSGYQSLDESELLEAIGELWRATGRRPTESLMNSEGKFSIRPYRTRWGSWRKAVDAYVRQYGVPVTNSSVEPFPAIRHRSDPNVTASPIVVAPTHTPKAVVNRRRILYGEPVDFRGLRYAPINEQGVVYLFGMVSKELGFLVKSVRTDYPDCEGKRALDASGTQWQHVRIEFEYKSSNFVAHGHDPDGCDLIVC